jgi:hypothetical protein
VNDPVEFDVQTSLLKSQVAAMAIVTDWILEQFLRLPETRPALEFEYGRITPEGEPTAEHRVLQKHLLNLFHALGVGRACPELRIVMPES